MSKKRGTNKNSSSKKYVKKKTTKKVDKKKNGKEHPLFYQELSLGQRAADFISKFGGSWTFIIIFFSFLFIWMVINSWLLMKRPFDPYPYILLNLVLSCLAAVQAPIILMSQNRQAERDRVDAKYDHQVNRKAEREIQSIQKDLQSIRKMIRMLANGK